MNFVNKINSSINSSFELKYSYPTICNGIKKETNRQNNDLSLRVLEAGLIRLHSTALYCTLKH